MKIKRLKEFLEKSWSAETAKGDWTPNCPSLNQCAVTAMLIQDLYGGDLLRCKCSDGDSHYWNRLPNGVEIDLTFEQFEYSGVIPDKKNSKIRDRKYVDSFEDTVKRCNLLKVRLVEQLIIGLTTHLNNI